MSRIRIMADSSSDLPRDLAAKLDITLIPTPVHFGEERLRDGVDFTPTEFYERMARESELPRTSQPDPLSYIEPFRVAHEAGETVICLCLSSGLSGGYQSAELAVRELPGAEIHVLDTKAASMGFGLLVLKVAEDVQNGLPVEQVLSRFEENKRRLYSLFTLNTLDNLQRGGRITKVAAVFGSILQIKPVLHLDADGRINIVDRARGREKALARLISLAQESADDLKGATVGLSHAHCLEDAEAFAERARRELGVGEVIIGDIGAAIGTHTGPGCIAFFVLGRPRW